MNDILSSYGFMPHGHCYLWTPLMVWIQASSNFLIGAAYMSISATLVYLVRRVRDVPFKWMYLAFGVFIVTCGLTHFLDVWMIWTPLYWLDAGVRTVTALASAGTALLLFPLVPKAVALGEAARVAHERGLQLEVLNRELAALYERSRETLAEAIPQLVWTNTPDGRFDYRNRRWSEYAGPRTREPDFEWTRIMHPDDLPPLQERWRECLARGEPFEGECRLQRADGAWRWHLARALPLRDGGRIVRWFGTMTDIDDQRRIAEERERLLRRTQEALESRDVFIAVAAHELRTPLTPLRMQVESLQRGVRQGRALEPGRVAEKLAVAVRQMDRLGHLVDELLDVSRLAGGRLQLDPEPLDLSAVVRDVADRHRPQVERECGRLQVRASAPVPGRWDRLRLEQVITNLLVNALKFCEGRPVELEVEGDAAGARVRVRDRGPGIAPEDQARIFERFERAASARHYGGLGLGLWIANQIVAAHGGRIRVDSAPGAGSVFTVELPREPPENQAHEQT